LRVDFYGRNLSGPVAGGARPCRERALRTHLDGAGPSAPTRDV
jgi:hypothetical protein